MSAKPPVQMLTHREHRDMWQFPLEQIPPDVGAGPEWGQVSVYVRVACGGGGM